LKLTVLPQAEAKGIHEIISAFLDLHLKQHCSFLMLAFFVKKTIFREGVNNKIGILHTNVTLRGIRATIVALEKQ
jgi:hypothetical protein